MLQNMGSLWRCRVKIMGLCSPIWLTDSSNRFWKHIVKIETQTDSEQQKLTISITSVR